LARTIGLTRHAESPPPRDVEDELAAMFAARRNQAGEQGPGLPR
jgi:hypothetical protein